MPLLINENNNVRNLPDHILEALRSLTVHRSSTYQQETGNTVTMSQLKDPYKFTEDPEWPQVTEGTPSQPPPSPNLSQSNPNHLLPPFQALPSAAALAAKLTTS